MEKHVNVVAVLQLLFSFFIIFIGVLGFVVLKIIGDITNDNDAEFILTLIGSIAIGFFFIVGLPGLFAGLGLFKWKEWARILTILLSVINLFNVPVGTAVGAYSIWVLTHPETNELFRAGKKQKTMTTAG